MGCRSGLTSANAVNNVTSGDPFVEFGRSTLLEWDTLILKDLHLDSKQVQKAGKAH